MPMRSSSRCVGVLRWKVTVRDLRKVRSDQEWSSPGQWPGKSVEVTFVTVSGVMPTTCGGGGGE